MPAGYFGWSLLDGQRGYTTLRDVLHNLSARENGDNHEHSRGVLVGVVSTFMACGMDFDNACKLVWQTMPTDCHYERFPPSWVEKFTGKIRKDTFPVTPVKRP